MNMRSEEMNRRQRRMEVSSEGGNGPEGPEHHGWMDGYIDRYQVILVLWYSLQMMIMASCQNG
jgi:hypothetical protein